MGIEKTQKKIKIAEKYFDEYPEQEIFNEEWEMASDEDLQSGEFKVI